MMALFGCFALAMMAWLNHRVVRSVLYPPFLFSAYWSVVLGLIGISKSTLDQLSPQAVLLFAGGAVAFSVGGLPAIRYRKTFTTQPAGVASIDNKLLYFVLFVELALIPAYIAKMATDRWTGDLAKLLILVRTAATTSQNDGNDVTGGFRYMIWMSGILAMVTVAICRGRRSKMVAVIATLMSCVYHGMTGARLGLSITFLAIAGIRFVQKRRISLLSATVTAGVILILFAVVGASLNKISVSQDEGIMNNTGAVIDSFRQYSIGGPVAFSAVMANRDVIAQEGSHVFRTPMRYFRSLGFNVNGAPIVQSYSYIPFPINVYSIYFPFYIDFGVMGVVLGLMATGFVFTLAFENSRGGGAVGAVMYGITFSYILLSAADEYLFTLISANLQALITLAVFWFWRSRRVKTSKVKARVPVRQGTANERPNRGGLVHGRVEAYR